MKQQPNPHTDQASSNSQKSFNLCTINLQHNSRSWRLCRTEEAKQHSPSHPPPAQPPAMAVFLLWSSHRSSWAFLEPGYTYFLINLVHSSESPHPALMSKEVWFPSARNWVPFLQFLPYLYSQNWGLPFCPGFGQDLEVIPYHLRISSLSSDFKHLFRGSRQVAHLWAEGFPLCSTTQPSTDLPSPSSPQFCRDVLMLREIRPLIPSPRTSPTAKFSSTTQVLIWELRTWDQMTGTARSIWSLFREKGGGFPFLALAFSLKLFSPLKPNINNDGRSYFPWGNANFNAFFNITIALLRNK